VIGVIRLFTLYTVHAVYCLQFSIGECLWGFTGERERLASDRLAVANSRASAAAAALEEVRMRMAEVQAQVEEEQQARLAAEARARTLDDQLRQVQSPLIYPQPAHTSQ
jgi:hypothetical protein